jgi:hypothetical protein
MMGKGGRDKKEEEVEGGLGVSSLPPPGLCARRKRSKKYLRHIHPQIVWSCNSSICSSACQGQIIELNRTAFLLGRTNQRRNGNLTRLFDEL